MKRLTPEEIDEMEWRKHEERYAHERDILTQDAIALGIPAGQAETMDDAELVALVNRLEDEQDDEPGSAGEVAEEEDPIAALLDDIPPPAASDLGLLGETVRTEHGCGQVVMVRSRVVGGGWVTDLLVEDTHGLLRWASHAHSNNQKEEAA